MERQQQQEASDDRHDETVVVDANQSSQRNSNNEPSDTLLAEDRAILFLVATIMATISFQAVMNPPGGVFQDDSTVSFVHEPIRFTHYMLFVKPRIIIPPEKNKTVSSMNDYYYFLDFIENLEKSVRAYYPYRSPPGLIWEDDIWNRTITNYKREFFPYLVRYAGTPIFSYLYPAQYSAYVTLFSIAFYTCSTIILAPIIEFYSIVNKPYHLKALKNMLYFSILCVIAGYGVGFVCMCPPYANYGLKIGTLVVSACIIIGCYVNSINWPRSKLWLKKKLDL